jgi:N-acyl-D-aspartate/D-glutamate deacylase
MSDIPFDVDRVARLELQWWIVHRERWKRPPDELPKALAELQAAIYGVPVERVLEHGRLRAQAMAIRDTKADDGQAMTEEDWTKINDLLRGSWRSLADVVKNTPNALPNNRAGDSR